MKITRKNLKQLIAQEVTKSRSMLLEQPADYRYEDSLEPVEEEPVDLLAQQLHHLGRQADTLFQIVSATEAGAGSSNRISDKTRETLIRLAEEFEQVFKAVEMDHSRPDRGY